MRTLPIRVNSADRRPGRAVLFALMAVACWIYTLPALAAQTISYVQGNYAAPQTPQATVNVTFTAAQAAGDLNVVVVGWNDSTATVSTVTDTRGNIYTRAVGPTVQTGVASQSIYYAKNIVAAAAGANTVTVAFTSPAAFPDIRIVEYRGADLANPVDVTAANSGSSTTSSSGAATTTNATDMLFGANLVQTLTTGPGSGFTRRLLTSPDGDIVEDRMVTATGSYSATAPVRPSGQWIMQLVAFRTPVAGGDTQPPTAPSGLTATAASGTQINLNWTASSDNVGVTGYLIERCPGAGCTAFAQIGTSTATTFNDTGLTNATTYSYRVRATDAAGNLSGYSNTASGTTLDTQPPTAPSSLTGTAAGGSQVNLSWTASTDNVGVTQYLVERCQGAGCTTFAQVGTSAGTTFTDTGLTPNTSYSYRVRATDAAGNLSGYSNVATAVTQNPDTQPPTTPSNLTATAAGGSQINLTWTASTDNVGVTQYLVERCQGSGCATFAQVGTSTGTTFNDTGLTNATSYSYRVRATDAAGNLSGYSSVASATTLDTQPPTAPSNLTATAAGGSQINLSWTASADNVGVTQYLVERCQGAGCTTFAQIGTSIATTFSDSGLTNGTSYSYRVRATDAAGNLGGYSNTATATTLDTQPPTTPSNLTATAAGGSQINLSWTASVDNVGVTQYLVERCQGAGCTTFAQIGTATATTFNDTGLTPNTSYSYRIRATDAAGNLSGYSNVASATTPATIPGLVAAYSFNEGTGTTVADASGTGNAGTVANTTWTTSGKFGNALVFNGTSSRVTISDSAFLHLTNGMTLEAWVNPSAVSSAWRDVIYKGNDNYYVEETSTNGSRPAGGGTWGATGVTVYGTSALTANTWAHLALTYDGANLRFYVNGTQVSSQARTGSIMTSTNPLEIGSDSLYGQYFSGVIDEVRVYNLALTAAQIQADMTTPIGNGIPDTQPPTAPSNLSATAVSGTQINLSWTASVDNVGVTGYLIERCQGTGCTTFTQIGTSTGTTFNDPGLTASTTYSYRVRATDAAGNLSSYSSVASATTQTADTQPPTAPTNLTATAISGTQINLSWTASVDNVGVTGYLIERCQGVGCTNFGRLLTVPGITYSDTGLVSNTNYTYQVKATDAAGNFSPYSNTATAATLATIPGLVAAYSFDEGAGTTVTDLSGNGNNGTLTNTAWTSAAKFGNALVFNGSSSLVTINDSASLHLTTGMTLETWVNPSTVTNAWRDVIYKGNDNYFLEGTSDTGAPGGGGTFGGVGGLTRGTAALPANAWSHLALTYDGVTLRLYVNGGQVSSLAQTGNIATSGNPLQIGGDSIFGQYFVGTIDEVRVYNTALNQAQIQSDMVTAVGGGGSFPLVSLSSTNINFGNVATGASSSPQPVTLTNIGGAQLTISSIGISGGNSGDFSQTNNCGTTVAPGGSCTINVTFTPTTTGARSSAVAINDNAPGSPHTISLSGTGTGFSISPRVAALTFTRTQQFTASNSSVTWSVDGVVGGSASSGTITNAGFYTPPNSVGTHTVTATTLDQSQSASATVYITNYPGTFTFHNDNLRSGLNSNETVLTPANVNQAQFGKLLSYPLDGLAFASPLYVANVNIPNQGFHNVVYVATEHDTVYAFDADGLSANPLWQVSFLGPGVTPIPCADTGECGDIPNEIGITGTPAIDQVSGTLYVVAKTKEGSNHVQRLHALDIATGAEKFGGPVNIQASVPGNGNGAANGHVPFDPLRENQRPGLLVNNGVVYIAWASHGDVEPWHGWVIGYNATSLQQQTMAYNVSPNGYGGGIWQSGEGLATDSSGNVFFATGNGDFNGDTGGPDFGDSVVKLSPAGNVVDYFTPFDQGVMEQGNFDLSSAGPVLLVDQPGPIPHRLVTAAKTGTIYVINRDNMGHFQSGSDGQIIQSLPGVLPHGGQEEGNYSAPVFFNNNVYYGAVNDNLKIFQFTNGLLSSGPVSQSPETYPNRGASFAVSASGSTNGLLWAIQDNTPANGVLRVYEANNLANELYNSSQAGNRDTLGFVMKFSIPLVANGKAFVVVQNQLTEYGPLP